MKIAIIGAGALGLYYGAMLQRGGNDVQFLLRRDYKAIRAKGLTVTSVNGDFHLPEVKGVAACAELERAELIIVGLKTFHNDQLVELCRPAAGENTIFLTLQNGLGNEEVLAATFGEDRVMGGVAFLCSNRGEPGTVHHLGQGAIRLGEFGSGGPARAEKIAALFRKAGIPCETVTDLVKARWEKLIWNIPFNGLCALTQRPTGYLLSKAAIRREVEAIMREVIAGANAQGLSAPIDATEVIPRLLEVTETMGDYRPSMMIDRQEGRPLELEAIYGRALSLAASRNIDMGKTRLLQALLQLEEQA
ncbi:putative 2-dehydropantoate 2-reductase [Desulfuromonas sp. AOP6]|uniref:putative 2-dehydropantoate 2-reductase n=1 Tax=Desulfuromonas sp. AOP6 TaxID=1566351 RepID=UPI00127549AD|nr:putative 2-dehydropantoate 2-reductase [Desulfuromonas sp. AOP6]BCA78305.1 2-dehydropantoate 2-reductase [Desulfuromonas sp. AOP6]